MTVGVRKRRKITETQYLAMERASETKSEYFDGEVFAMAGTSRRHGILAGNAFAALHPQVRQQRCDIFQNDMRVKVAATGLYTYPDVVVACGGGQYEDTDVDTLLNPTIIIEVLSKSTMAYDRGEKFQQYRKLPSLGDYILVSQDRRLIEHYSRQPDGRWLLSEYSELSDVIELPSIGCHLALRDVYDQVIVAIKEEGPTWHLSPLQEAR